MSVVEITPEIFLDPQERVSCKDLSRTLKELCDKAQQKQSERYGGSLMNNIIQSRTFPAPDMAVPHTLRDTCPHPDYDTLERDLKKKNPYLEHQADYVATEERILNQFGSLKEAFMVEPWAGEANYSLEPDKDSEEKSE